MKAVKEVDLYYPNLDDIDRTPDEPQAVKILLISVRAADEILVEYDFDRDGYKISMPTKHQWKMDEITDPKWAEVAFIPAWAGAGMSDCDCDICQEAKAVREGE